MALAAAEADERVDASEEDSPESTRDAYRDKLFRSRS
jgi:hypothetical protein